MIRLADAPRPSPRLHPAPDNDRVSEIFLEVADLLDLQGASPFRVRAYREGAASIRSWSRDVRDVLRDEGRDGLEAREGIGASLSAAISEIVTTGRLRMADRLRGLLSPEEIFTTLPGVGPELAHAIHHHLGVETLEELEVAAWDGRLADVPGFGPRRVEALRAVLTQRLSGRRVPRWIPERPREKPSVLEILSVDREYRRRAAAGELQLITPRRFNPERVAWLPVLHTERGPWHFQALYSNTGRAHRLGKTHDWVVVYYNRDGKEGQSTVVTETRGTLGGRRVVRGREAECADYYASAGPAKLAGSAEPDRGPEASTGVKAGVHHG
jgi:DNA polymerase (family 10)